MRRRAVKSAAEQRRECEREGGMRRSAVKPPAEQHARGPRDCYPFPAPLSFAPHLCAAACHRPALPCLPAGLCTLTWISEGATASSTAGTTRRTFASLHAAPSWHPTGARQKADGRG